MNRTKLIAEELKTLYWFSSTTNSSTRTDHLIPVTKSAAAVLPDIPKSQGKLYWTRGAAEAVLLAWAIREDGKRAEVFWESGERGLIAFSRPLGVSLAGRVECCFRR